MTTVQTSHKLNARNVYTRNPRVRHACIFEITREDTRVLSLYSKDITMYYQDYIYLGIVYMSNLQTLVHYTLRAFTNDLTPSMCQLAHACEGTY